MRRFVSALPAVFLLAAATTVTGAPVTTVAATAPATTADVAAGSGESAAVAVVVRIATPAGLTRERVVALMAQTVPEFQTLPGLVRKYYTISDDNEFGGIYLFRDRASAEKHFSPSWFAGVKKTYGVDANVLYFTAPIQIEGKNAQGTP